MDAESFKNEFLPYHRKLYSVAYRLQDICGPRVELRGKDCGIV